MSTGLPRHVGFGDPRENRLHLLTASKWLALWVPRFPCPDYIPLPGLFSIVTVRVVAVLNRTQALQRTS